MSSSEREHQGSGDRDLFVTTRWTMIQRAHGTDTTSSRRALEELCQCYWYPLYAYVRRCGSTAHDAEDLTQGFFARLLRLDSLASIDSRHGKFRAFLLASLKHFLADQRDFLTAQRRDVRATISLDVDEAEERYRTIPADTLSPDQVYDRQWAVTLLDGVMQRLTHEYEAAGRGSLFAELRFAIAGEKSNVPYRELAARLNVTEETVSVAVHRLRQRYRAALREELAQTVSSDEEVREELRTLRRIFSQ